MPTVKMVEYEDATPEVRAAEVDETIRVAARGA